MGAASALVVVPDGATAIEPGDTAIAIPFLGGDPSQERLGFRAEI